MNSFSCGTTQEPIRTINIASYKEYKNSLAQKWYEIVPAYYEILKVSLSQL